ncbi:60S ribosomal protein L43, variant 2 [Metarhizium acridum]|uniref:60S ribosomal protein L43 n=1 Tax=Metarhizium acridum TaxID=92637 RepID=UPI001C6BD878|nr:60S ribosomal protein L43 [Metarhizium acridum]KAG8416655.1 60S ribosomal protein L43, variant 2 [Metarhizium acridum]
MRKFGYCRLGSLPSPTTTNYAIHYPSRSHDKRHNYGASLRKQVKKMEITQHAKYTCTFCGKVTVKRHSTGIWNCKGCNRTIAGGAYVVATPAAAAMRSTLRRLREIAEV